MIFNSLEFLIFLPIVYLLYWVIPKKYKWIFLLLASYIFYMFWNATLIFLILFTTLVSYLAGIMISKNENQKIRKLWLALTIIVCLGVLFFFKYFNFLANSIVTILGLTGLKIQSFALDLLLPVGISFYTFQTLSYVIDVYRRKINVEKHLGYYALYVSFFPQLVAGPIERPENLLPQLHNPKNFSTNDMVEGMKVALFGFVKKIAIADVLAIYVNNVYNNLTNQTGLSIVIATILFAFQIYCDFSGYSDIAIGVSKMMGYDLMENFNEPYKATSIKDFWSRWHISLSTWFRDYVYIPLGGNRCKKARHLTNLFIVFLLSGLWHGANWTFVIWGALHGIYQVIGILTKSIRHKTYAKLKIDENGKFALLFKRFVTFSLVCVAWVFFRANSAHDILRIGKRLLLSWGVSKSYFMRTIDGLSMNLISAFHVIFSLTLLTILPKIVDSKERAKRSVDNKVVYIVLAIIVVLSWCFTVANGTAGEFIYFQF